MNTITFKEFWDAYGLKRDKVAAERAWKRLGKRDQRAAFNGIAAYREDCEKHGRMMMYAQGYLNHRRWEDELDGNSKFKIQNSKLSPAAPSIRSTPITPSTQSAAAERDREAEARNRQREEWQRKSVSHEDAMKDPEYLRALQEA